jgi:antitoxin Phd
MQRKTRTAGEWTFKDAEARFAEVFRLARSTGPQRVSRRTGAVVVIPEEEYERLGPRRKEETLGEFLDRSPLKGVDLDCTRPADFGRNLEF